MVYSYVLPTSRGGVRNSRVRAGLLGQDIFDSQFRLLVGRRLEEELEGRGFFLALGIAAGFLLLTGCRAEKSEDDEQCAESAQEQ